MTLRFLSIAILIAVAMTVTAAPDDAAAQWYPPAGVVVVSGGSDDYGADLVPDGSGGVIAAWTDFRAGSWNGDVYCQRIDRLGNPVWAPNGIAVCIESHHQHDVHAVSDGAGGAYVVWDDSRTEYDDIYAQHILADGTFGWQLGGVPVCQMPGGQRGLCVAADGMGGFLVAWYDERRYHVGSVKTDVYVQRVLESGIPAWLSTGVIVCSQSGWGHNFPGDIVSDGAGGGYVTWKDVRSGYPGPYIQRVDSTGTIRWVLDGVRLDTADVSRPPWLVADAAGVIAAWSRNGTYLQRLDRAGSMTWSTTPKLVSTMAFASIASNNAGGIVAIMASSDLYAQQVDSLGVSQWQGDGKKLCDCPGTQTEISAVSDGAGGVFVAWTDDRNGGFGDWEIFGQWLDTSGMLEWPTEGQRIFEMPQSHRMTVSRRGAVVSGGRGVVGASLWDSKQIRVQSARVLTTGVGRAVQPKLFLSDVTPNPTTRSATCRLEVERDCRVDIALFDIAGRSIRSWQVSARAGTVPLMVEVSDSRGETLPSGVYFLRAKAIGHSVSTRIVVVR